MTAFWSSINGKLADRVAAISAPALVFWLGGLLAWSLGHGGLHSLAEPARWLSKQASVTQAAVLVVIIAAAGASGLIVSRVTLPVLRLLEGYWPQWPPLLVKLQRRLTNRVSTRAAQDLDAWLALRRKAEPGGDDLAKIYRLERVMHRRPNPPGPYQPTRTGNILRAAEGRPGIKYGLDAVTVWPQLWLVLPEASQQELAAARAALDSSVAATIWGILFCLFGAWTLLALPAGLLVAVVAAMGWVPARAEVFGSLLEAAFDLNRTALYRQLRWPLPDNPGAEITQGRMLTQYLWRGLDGAVPHFTDPP